MKTCGKDCPEVCDYCKFYNFNPDKNGAYIGLGYCKRWKVSKRPEDCCKSFHCELCEEEEK